MGTLCRELGIETVAVGEKMKALTETDPEAQWFAGVEEAMPAVRRGSRRDGGAGEGVPRHAF